MVTKQIQQIGMEDTQNEVLDDDSGKEFSIDAQDLRKLRQQVQNEYKAARDHLEPKQAIWYRRLRLYNNQKRDDTAVGHPLLFTTTQTVVASLYNDKMLLEWEGREEDGDDELAENLNVLAENDAKDMKKYKMDYDWIWDTGFFGKGYVEQYTFNRGLLRPSPKVLDPFVFLRDPYASSVNGLGDEEDGESASYLGYEFVSTKQKLKSNKAYKDVNDLRKGVQIKDSLTDLARQERDSAQGRQTALKGEIKGENDNEEVELLRWYTYWNGKRVLTVWGNGIEALVYFKELDTKYFPIVERSLYPVAHDWDNTSIADLVEDKQRAMSIGLNLGIKIQQADLYPMYTFDPNRIKNRADLNFDFNKFVPVEGGGDVRSAIAPINKVSPNMQLSDFILRTLDESAQRATATPEIQQGVMTTQARTATELNQVAANVDTRYGLSAKIFGWSEEEWWIMWYNLYKKHFREGIDEKMVRLNGAYGRKMKKLTRENIIAVNQDPDVKIESKTLSEAKRLREQASYERYITLAAKDPNVNIRYGLRKLGKLSGLERDEVERLIPPTMDELQAEEENEKLNENKSVPVKPEEDHQAHMEIHRMVASTSAQIAHIKTHRAAMLLKKEKPELFPQEQVPAGQEQAQVGAEAGSGAGEGSDSLGGISAPNNPVQELLNRM